MGSKLSAASGWLMRKFVTRQQKRQAEKDADTIGNIERLHRLKEKGIITDEDFTELKEKLKKQIG